MPKFIYILHPRKSLCVTIVTKDNAFFSSKTEESGIKG